MARFHFVVRVRVAYRSCFRLRIECRVSDAVVRDRSARIDVVRLVSCVRFAIRPIHFFRARGCVGISAISHREVFA